MCKGCNRMSCKTQMEMGITRCRDVIRLRGCSSGDRKLTEGAQVDYIADGHLILRECHRTGLPEHKIGRHGS